jgi:AcrR family transcriptional regulator
MEVDEIKYPVGLQDFENIRQGKFLYVDKTGLIYKLVSDSKYVFLSRPRRFGKTLLTSTLHYYFDGRKDLFTGLAMERLEKDWTTYPVLHFDLGRMKELTADELRLALHELLNKYDKRYAVTTSGTPGGRLDMLIQEACNQSGHPAVVLIDEYDAPIMDALNQPDRLLEIRKVMRNFYASLKANEKYLRFVFITGVSTFSQMGIFSELNNLKKISSDDRYAAICGITEQELRDNFKQGVHNLAKKQGCSEEDMLAMLKDKYDGYHFSDAMLDIYNPFSLLNAFDHNKMDNYWFDSGTSSALVEAFNQYVGDFNLELDRIDSSDWVEPSDFMNSLEDHASIIPLLYQTGYLTIKSYDGSNEQYKLGMPNAEVRVGLLKNLLPLHLSAQGSDVSVPAGRASTALRQGDIGQAMEILRSLLKSIPYGKNETKKFHDIKTTEQYYHDLFHFFFSMMCNLVNSEVRNSTGATDVVITTPNYLYVVEIKIDSTPEVALSQIEEKGYAVPYLTGPRKVVKVGANFSTKEKTLSGWKVTEG